MGYFDKREAEKHLCPWISEASLRIPELDTSSGAHWPSLDSPPLSYSGLITITISTITIIITDVPFEH